MIWCLRDQQFFLSFCLKKLVTKQNWSLFIYTFDLLGHNFKRQISCKFFWGQFYYQTWFFSKEIYYIETYFLYYIVFYTFLFHLFCLFTPLSCRWTTSVCMLVGVRVLVFNTTFNNISFISWRSVWLVGETGGPWENHRPAACHLYDSVVEKFIYINTCIYIIFFYVHIDFFNIILKIWFPFWTNQTLFFFKQFFS